MHQRFTKIVAIIPKGIEETYNLCINSSEHYYVANGLINRNSNPNLQQAPSRRDKLAVRAKFVANVKIPEWFKQKHPGDLL